MKDNTPRCTPETCKHCRVRSWKEEHYCFRNQVAVTVGEACRFEKYFDPVAAGELELEGSDNNA